MISTKQLINKLSEESSPARSCTNPVVLLAKLLAFSLIYITLLLSIFHFRPDISEKIASPLFISELVILLLLVITSALSAVLLSFPDMYQKKRLVFAPLLSIILFVATLALEYIADSESSSSETHGAICLLCITMFSVVPAILMFWFLRRQATTHYYISGAISLLAAYAIGALALRLSEYTDSIIHLIMWHYLPMVGVGIIGLWLGKKIFRW